MILLNTAIISFPFNRIMNEGKYGSCFFRKREKIRTAEKLFSFLEEEKEESKPPEDLFSSFLYRDHVTRYRY